MNPAQELTDDQLDFVCGGGGASEGAFVVLMNATNSQDNDLQTIMNEVQAQTNAKNFLRNQIARSGK
jgi:hypothetical protein